ncbi:MAG: M1 family aminopeptidase [Myxococcota bacterium]
MRRSTIVAGLSLVFAAAACSSSKQTTAQADGHRPADAILDTRGAPNGKLPSYATPLAYAIELTIDPDRDAFAGNVSITVKLEEPRDHIWLHGRGLRVATASVKLADGKLHPVRYQEIPGKGLAFVGFEHTIEPQEVVLSFGYEATYGGNLEGLYTVSAQDQRYAFAQFEPISARLCFPSFDEPRFKTPFDITLITRREHVAVSTTAIAAEQEHGTLKTTRFKVTEKLPTYLITFAVGDFDVVDGGKVPANAARAEPLPLRGIAVKGKGPGLKESLQTTAQLVTALETYFGIGYPFGKLDVIAVPDFAYGAMENVGAVTFRDFFLVLDPATATVLQRRESAYVIAHELAHMWFGNIVTPAWWDDIWLNEAFASWMGHRVVQAWNPALGANLDRVHAVHHAMEDDWLPSARQVRQPVTTNDDIFNAFDAITYQKGMGVLSMFESFLGADPFRKAVQLHLNKFRFATATADDFFTSLTEATGKDVIGAMRGFIEQGGLPLLETNVRCNAGAAARLSIKQSRALPLGVTEGADRAWQIPVCVRYESGGASARQECWMLDKPEINVTVSGRGCPSWLMPNARGGGYYRFTMDNASLDALVYAATVRKLEAAEIVSLANNLLAGLRSGGVSAAAALRFATTLSPSADSRVAGIAMSMVEVVRDDIAPPHLVTNAEVLGRDLYKRRAGGIFVVPTKESDEAHLTRVKVAGFLTNVARDPAVRLEAAKRGEQALQALEQGQPLGKIIEPDMLAVALGAAIDAGGPPTHERAANMLATVTDPVLRREIVHGLADTRDPALADKSLALLLDPRLRINELQRLFKPIAAHRETREQAWKWLQTNFAAFLARASLAEQSVLPQHVETLCSPEAVESVDAFFAPRLGSIAGGPRSLTLAKDTIAACAAMANSQRESAEKFLGTIKVQQAPVNTAAKTQ